MGELDSWAFFNAMNIIVSLLSTIADNALLAQKRNSHGVFSVILALNFYFDYVQNLQNGAL